MILSTEPLKNPFKIDILEIEGMDLSQHFISLNLEENIFSPFIYGTLILNRKSMITLDSWSDQEFGFLDREFKMSWTHDIVEESSYKDIILKVYGVSERTSDTISLLLIQPMAINYLNKQFCDGWVDTKISEIVSNIISVKAKISDFKVTSTSNSFTFTNPLIWAPNQSLKYLTPMMKSSSGDCAYLTFSSTRESGKMYCVPVNELFKNDVLEDLVTYTKQPEDKKNVQVTLNIILEYNFSQDYGNILEQTNDDVFGLGLDEYDPKTKIVNHININNIVKDNIKQLGSKSSVFSKVSTTDSQYAFYFSKMNGEIIEKSETMYEYIKKNSLIISTYGMSTRNVGDVINLNLYSEKNYMNDPMNEFSGKNMVSGISHIFSPMFYYQKLTCVRSGYNNFKQREVT